MWKFIKSSSDKSNWLIHDNEEICFIGRSNVGKSSLINALARNSKLAKVSKMPGRTQLINYFQNENDLIIVDLPGYGYANISYSIQEKMFNMIDEYFRINKPSNVFFLIDSRHGITPKDAEIIGYLLNLNHNLIFILTKVDKAKQKEIAKTLKNDYLKNFKYFKSSIDNEKLINAIRDEINKY